MTKPLMKWRLLCLLILVVTGATVHGQSVTGTVVDEAGRTMPGVTVRIEGTTKGAATDVDGRYTIGDIAPGEHTLIFSFVGYESRTESVTLSAGETQNLDVAMKPTVESLAELVVVGYGVQREREVTGSISKIESKDITDIPTPSFESSLQGKAAGVQVTQGSGLAGSGSVVRIRGIASISAAGDPLYVVDGIPITQDYFMNDNRGAMNNNPLATINPNDIESIEILKDAAATGIYGSRGANGVILITTKTGKGKGWSFGLNTRHGIAFPTARPNMLDSDAYLQLYQEAWENDGNVGRAPLPGSISWEDALNTNTDWVDEVIHVGLKQSYNFSAGYGTDKLNLFSSIGYDDNGSYLKGNSYERTSFRTNVSYELHPKLTLSGGVSVNRGVNHRVDAGWSGGLGAAMSTALPIYPIFFTDTVFSSGGDVLHLPGDYWSRGSNPVRQRELQDWRTTEWRSINHLSLEYRPLENLFIKGYGGYDYLDLKDDKFTDAMLRMSDRMDHRNHLIERWSTFTNNFNFNATATYLHSIDDDNKLTYMIGGEYQESRTLSKARMYREDSEVTGPYHDDTDVFDEALMAVGDSIIRQGYLSDGRNRREVYNFVSGFARVNYARQNKYFAQVTFRADGSSRFGENNRFGFFPSASLGWIVSEEAFLADSKVISFLKLRAGWGITGNAAIPNYQQYGEYILVDNGYNDETYRFLSVSPNPNLQWETSNVVDVAVEMGFFEDRITSTLSFYHKHTTDVLLNLHPQPSTGFSTFWDNVGAIVNSGVELEISSVNVEAGKFSWTTDFNVAYNYNEIKSIGDYTADAIGGGTNDTRVVVGKPVGTNYLVVFSHIDPVTGRNVYLDRNGEETYEWNADFRQAVGRVLPKAVGGMTNTFSYGRWDLGLVFVFSVGSNIYDSSSKRQLGVVTDWNMRTDIYDRWRQPGDDAEYARLSRLAENYGLDQAFNNNTTQWLKDGDYLRVRRLSLTYNLPRFNVGKAEFRAASITFSAVNFLTFTNFDGLDPEIARDFENATDRNMSSNITYLTPPQEKSFNLAINLNF